MREGVSGYLVLVVVVVTRVVLIKEGVEAGVTDLLPEFGEPHVLEDLRGEGFSERKGRGLMFEGERLK